MDEQTQQPKLHAELLNALQSWAEGSTGSELWLDEERIAHSCTDWRKRYRTHALAVVLPKTTQQLREVVKLCAHHKVAICTQGGNTGLVGGAVPTAPGAGGLRGENADRPHVLLVTRKLRDTLEVDLSNLTLSISAGYTLQEAQEEAEKHGLLFPLSLASEGTCTIGGNLASNAGGVAVLRYGNTRELCLSLEYVNAQGQICGDLRGLRKNNTGYDLRHLMIGSEGTLGLITRACLKLYPAPTAKVVVWMNVKSIHTAVALLGRIQSRLYNELSSYEWMNAHAIDLVCKHFQLKAPMDIKDSGCEHVLAEFTALGSQQALEEKVVEFFEELFASGVDDALGLLALFVAQSLSENDAFWALRENISEAQAKEGLNVKHDIACAVSALPSFHDAALAELQALDLGVRPVLFGHLGDGNLHFNVSGPAGEDSKNFLAAHQDSLNEIVHRHIMLVGGTVSAEHGIGQLKAELLQEITAPPNYQAFQAIKRALDPDNLLNPGKLILL
ncbi:MAG: FAD-binding oxidoreductase [Limnobacter sp.]|nr:FAD-binding oxidoreductase [Limnobacter sp.]